MPSWTASRRGAPVVAAGLVALLVTASGCAGDAPGAACMDPTTAPPAELALLPAGLSFDQVGPVTDVVSTDGHVTVRAVSSLPLEESTVRIQDAVTAAGYRPAGMDNEGFEAEVFFVSGSYAAGQALVRRGVCDGTWDVELVLVDPDVIPSEVVTPTTSSTTS